MSKEEEIQDLSEFWKTLYGEEVHGGMLVLGKIKRTEEHGVYIDLSLLEAEAYCPVKELSSRRVITPKDVIHQGQQVVGKIYRVRRGGKVLSVSLKRVSNQEKERRREKWRKLRRTFSIFRTLEENLEVNTEDLIEMLGKPLLKYFKTVFDGLKEIVMEGKGLLQELDVPEEYMADIYEVLEKAIKVTKRELKKEIKVSTLAPKGIERIKGAFQKAKEVSPENIKIKYLSAPRYSVKVAAYRWKDASKRFKEFEERLKEKLSDIPSKWKTKVDVLEGKQ